MPQHTNVAINSQQKRRICSYEKWRKAPQTRS